MLFFFKVLYLLHLSLKPSLLHSCFHNSAFRQLRDIVYSVALVCGDAISTAQEALWIFGLYTLLKHFQTIVFVYKPMSHIIGKAGSIRSTR